MAFFNYDKPGKGVEKDAPRAKGVFLYFDLLWRKLGRLLLVNILYFVTSLPVLFLYYILAYGFLGTVLPQGTADIARNQAAVIAVLVIASLWGTGPVSCGLCYILRNIAREEHTFLVSDFFEQCKKGFFHALVFLAVDFAMLIVGTIAFTFYWSLASGGGVLEIALMATVVAIFVLYTAMHFYLYEVEVTFTGKLLSVYKNSFALAAATLPMCLLLGAIVIFVSFGFLGNVSPLGIVFFALIFWMSVIRFIPEFYTARYIKRKLIPDESDAI